MYTSEEFLLLLAAPLIAERNSRARSARLDGASMYLSVFLEYSRFYFFYRSLQLFLEISTYSCTEISGECSGTIEINRIVCGKNGKTFQVLYYCMSYELSLRRLLFHPDLI